MVLNLDTIYIALVYHFPGQHIRFMILFFGIRNALLILRDVNVSKAFCILVMQFKHLKRVAGI